MNGTSGIVCFVVVNTLFSVTWDLVMGTVVVVSHQVKVLLLALRCIGWACLGHLTSRVVIHEIIDGGGDFRLVRAVDGKSVLQRCTCA